MNKPVLGIVLLVLASLQLGMLARSQSKPIVISEGMALPVAIRALDDSTSLLDGRGCVSLVVCAASCPYCAAKAASRLENESRTAVDELWAILGSPEIAAQFAREHAFDPNSIGFIDPSNFAGWSFRRRHLVIPGTPLSVVLNNVHKVSHVGLTNTPTAGVDLERLCNR
jgi:ferredoxin